MTVGPPLASPSPHSPTCVSSIIPQSELRPDHSMDNMTTTIDAQPAGRVEEQGVADTSANPETCKCTVPGRNLVVCIDGTSNLFGIKNSNVVELYHLLEKDRNQITFYNSGIGTYAKPSWKSSAYYLQVLDNITDLRIAWHFEKTVHEAYQWLSENYRHDDRIFLFGFSRGAYQVRCISAMIHHIGLIHRGNEAQIPFAYELYANCERDRGADEMAARFKQTFSRSVRVHFVGVWDTVSSVGRIRGKRLPGTTSGMKHTCFFRHALALHERRVQFLPVYAYGGSTLLDAGDESSIDPIATPHTKEVWFAGSHNDLGVCSGRNNPPLEWMSKEATAAGIRLHPYRRGTERDFMVVRDALSPAWFIWEFLPFRRFSYQKSSSVTTSPHLGRGRVICRGQKIHHSVLQVDNAPSRSLPKASLHGLEIPSSWGELCATERDRRQNWIEYDREDLEMTQTMAFIDNVLKGSDDAEIESESQFMSMISSPDGFHALHGACPHLLSLVNDTIKTGQHTDRKFRILRAIGKAYATRDGSVLERTLGNREMVLLAALLLSEGTLDDHKIAMRLARSTNVVPKNSRGHFTSISALAIPREGGEVTWAFVDETFSIHRASAGLRGKAFADGISSINLSPSATKIVSGGYDQTVRIWSAETGEQLGISLNGHEGLVGAVAWAPNENGVASGSHDCTIRIWDIATRAAVGSAIKGHDRPVTSVTFSSDGTKLASGSHDCTVRVWNADTAVLHCPPLVGHISGIASLVFSPDTRRIASGSYDCTVRVWNIDPCDAIGLTFYGHKSWVKSVAFSPDGTRIVSGSNDRTIRLWDAWSGRVLREIFHEHQDWVWDTKFSSDPNSIISASIDGAVLVSSAAAQAPANAFYGHTDAVSCVSFSPDGNRIISGSRDCTIIVWDLKTGRVMNHPFEGHTDNISSIRASTHGNTIVSGSFDRTVRVWSLETGEQVGKPFRGHEEWISSVDISPNGHHAASGSWDKTIRIWNLASGHVSNTIHPLDEDSDSIRAVAFSSDGAHILCGTDVGSIGVWDVLSGAVIMHIAGSVGGIMSLAIAGTNIVSGCGDGSLRILDAVTYQPVGGLRGHTKAVRSVHISPDGKHIVSGSLDHTIRLWSMESWSEIVAIEGHGGWVTSVAYSPDGKRIASASMDTTLRLWDAATGEAVNYD